MRAALAFLLLGLLLAAGQSDRAGADSARRSDEDRELVALACRHAAHAFLLDNIETVELEASAEGTEVQSLVQTHLQRFINSCVRATAPQQALNVSDPPASQP